MSAGKAVNANVLLFDPVTGERHFIEAGEVPDKEFADQLGDHLFVEPDDGDDEGTSGVPPQSGKGSGKEAWAAYAARFDPPVDVPEDANRDDIIAAVHAAGYPVE